MPSRRIIIAAALCVICTTVPTPASAAGRVLRLEELSFTDIDALDREKTVFVLTFGNLEEHGPHLPVGSDYFQAVAVRDGMIRRLRASHPDRDFVLFPILPLGEGGANDVAGQPDHIGTFALRFETLRNVTMDLGRSIAAKGFRNILLVHGHGAPLHNMAFTDAARFVSERFNARMVNVTSLVFGEGFYSQKVMERHLGKGWEEKLGFEGHAGAAETAANLHVRRQLVKPEFRRLQPFVAKDMQQFLRTGNRPGWRGYWGDPAKATPALGRELVEDFAERSARIAGRALRGEDLSTLPIYPETLPPLPEADALFKTLSERYARQTAEIDTWLKQQTTRR